MEVSGVAAAVIPSRTVSEESLAPANVEVHVGGNLTGTVVAGNYNVVNTADGAVINVFRGKITTERRPLPVLLRPRPFVRLLGRTKEIAAVEGALRHSLPFEFHADAGWGKTVLLRHLVNRLSPVAHPEGLVYERAAGYPLLDILQFIFDAFYETSVPWKPTEGQLRHYLQSIRALVVLDDLDLSRGEVDSLLDAVPNCVFLVTAALRNLWGEGRVEPLQGLGDEEGLQLFEREVGRKLSSEERLAAKSLCESLRGHPLGLIEAATLVREAEGKRRVPIADLAREVLSPYRLTSSVVERLTDGERRLLGLLAALAGTPVGPEHVAAVARLPEAGTVLRGLEEQGLLESEGGGFRLRAGMSAAHVETLQPERWLRAVVTYFVWWAESHSGQPALLLKQSRALLAALAAAEGMGLREDVLRLVRSIEFAFALAARWGQWETVLRHGLRAAQALGDRAAAAWALHQLGTRATCLGDPQAAIAYLQQALELRRSIGDRPGAALTRHNLRRAKPRGWLTRRATIGAGAAVAGMVATIVVGLQVIAGTGEATLDPQQLDLGSVSVGQASSASIILENTGRGELAVDNMTVEGDFSQTNDCRPKRALAPRQRCTVTVVFAPKAAGPHNGRLSVNRAGGRASALLAGRGTAPNVEVQPGRLEFTSLQVGHVSGYQDVQLTNAGSAPLTVSDIKKTGDFEFTSRCGTLPASLPAQRGCTVSVRFTPTAGGRRNGSLVFSTSAGLASIALTGQGTESPSPKTSAETPLPTPALTPDQLDFGEQLVNTVSNPKQVTLRNAGIDPLSVRISTTGPFSATPASCSSIPAHGQCQIPVSFRPSSRGPASGSLVAVDSTGHQYRSNLSGTGLAPQASVSPKSLDWSDPKAPASQSVTISNTGNSLLTIRSVTVDSPNWKVDDVCNNVKLQPQDKPCTVTVTFQFPLGSGQTVTGQLSISDDSPDSPQTVSLTGVARIG
jgi:hypothetical protein